MMHARGLSLLRPLLQKTTQKTHLLSPPLLNLRTFITRSYLTPANVTIQCPSMGDSITEGTVIEWVVPVGGLAVDGEVVVIVETDKVTVDVKAEASGVITAHFSAVDDTVLVGGDLYSIDADASASVAAAVAVPAAAAAAAPAVEKEVAAPAASHAHDGPAARVPSIRFKGKAGWAAQLAGHEEVKEVEKAVAIEGKKVERATLSEDLDPMFGRPLISQFEMDALEDGGCELPGTPKLAKMGGGAIFKW